MPKYASHADLSGFDRALTDAYQAAVSAMRKAARYQHDGYDEAPRPTDTVLAAIRRTDQLTAALAELVRSLGRCYDWDDDDICRICGVDGRA